MKSLKGKILVRSISITSIMLLLLTAFLSTLNYKNTLEALEKTMKETSKVAAFQIETQLDVSKKVMSEIGMIERLSDNSISVEEKKNILNERRDTYSFKLISLALSDGMDLYGNSIRDRDFFNASIQGACFVSDPVISADGKSAETIISAPLLNQERRVVGVVYAVLDNEFLCKIVENIKVGDTGSAYMTKADYTVIAHKNRDLVYTQYNPVKAAEQDQSLEALAELEIKAHKGETVFGQYTFNGDKKFAVFSPINNTNGWCIGVNVEFGEFMQNTINAIIFAAIITVLALIIASIFNIKLAQFITKPVLEISKASERLAEGDLNVNISYKGNDELGRLAESFNTTVSTLNSYINDIARGCREIAAGNFDIRPTADFRGAFIEIADSIDVIIKNLSKTMAQIGCAAEQVLSGSDQIAVGSQSLAQGAAEQASSSEELSATIQEISLHINNNAENAELASRKAGHAGEQIQSSNTYMHELKTAMDEISNKSGEISKIIKVIEDIAFQTNILALNAAVEAARAGSAGKGFAVVADEVRSLASKSAEAAKDTTILIEETLAAIGSGTNVADKTAEALNESVKSTNDAIDLITDIALATTVQADAVSQISIGISQISSVTQTNSALAEESAAASEELTAQSKELHDLISHFKLLKTT